MVRFHFTFDKDKMSAWLNNMDRNGWQLKGFAAGWCSFEPAAAGTYDYQIDYMTPGIIPAAYRDLMADLSVEIVCRWGPWVVLRRPAALGPFQLYTDAASRVEHLRQVMMFFRSMACLEIICTMLLMGFSLQDRSWILFGIGCAGLAAAIGMVVRVVQLRRELSALGAVQYAMDTVARVLIAAGALLSGTGFFMVNGQFEPLAEFMRGCGCALLIIGCVRLILGRMRPA